MRNLLWKKEIYDTPVIHVSSLENVTINLKISPVTSTEKHNQKLINDRLIKVTIFTIIIRDVAAKIKLKLKTSRLFIMSV